MSPSKDLNTLLIYKNSLQNESEIKTFSDKHKLKKSITSCLSLKEILSSSRRKRISYGRTDIQEGMQNKKKKMWINLNKDYLKTLVQGSVG